MDGMEHLEEPQSTSDYATSRLGARKSADKEKCLNTSELQRLFPSILAEITKMITGSFTRGLWDHAGTRSSHREQTGISGERNYETFKSHNETPPF